MKNEPKAKKDRHDPVIYVRWAGGDSGLDRYRDATADPSTLSEPGEAVVVAKYELVGYVKVVNKTTVEG